MRRIPPPAILLALLAALGLSGAARAQEVPAGPLLPGPHRNAPAAPDVLLGFPLGERAAHPEQILNCFRAWAAAAPDRVRLESIGRSHEGRELLVAVISAPENLARLAEIRAGFARLADPRGLGAGESDRLLANLPAVAWMGYSIHGDEMSGADASLAVGWQLLASTDPATAEMLRRLVVVIDPCMNPDGRERILSMIEQSAGTVPSFDGSSMHRGRWPWGRGNHYLFDMNRDWIGGTQPETRARWKAILSFHPQLMVDAHEMGGEDTFLFYPQAAPHNPNLPQRQRAWHQRFAAGAAAAFDARGWTYYTREWADAWGPFYSDAWAGLTGATGILYEQASTTGLPLRRPSGRILTYREAVAHQAVASWANLLTLSDGAAEARNDWAIQKQRNVAADTPGNERVFVLKSRGNHEREAAFARMLLDQGIELHRANEAFRGQKAVQALGATADEVEFPAGSLLIAARQPMGPAVRSFLDFDVPYDAATLQTEREELERRGSSNVYDITSWNLAHALDLDAWWCDAPQVATTLLTDAPTRDSAILAPPGAAAGQEPVAWIVDGNDDASVSFAARALEAGLAVHWADETFQAAGRSFARGSVLVRRQENEGSAIELAAQVARIAAAASASVQAVATSRAPDEQSADLGGQHFHLLTLPRIALVGNAPVSTDSYGHVWHLLDRTIGISFTILDAQYLTSADLRSYNVIVLPEAGGGLRRALEPALEDLKSWIAQGGTLIACGSASAALTQGRLELGATVLREDALEDLPAFARAAAREAAARAVKVDAEAVYGAPAEAAAPEDAEEPSAPHEDEEEWASRFAPQGVMLRGLVDMTHWITAGAGDEMPVFVAGSEVYLSQAPVETPVRLAPAAELRLSGLLWPEARARLAESAWLTVESRGSGQIILFAGPPGFRGFHLASARLFANAAVFGAALGASPPAPGLSGSDLR
jgi:hypothetical protein